MHFCASHSKCRAFNQSSQLMFVFNNFLFVHPHVTVSTRDAVLKRIYEISSLIKLTF